MAEKQKIIDEAYNDKGGFGSKLRTLNEARKKDKTISIEDVNKYFQKSVEQKRKPRGENSFIAPHAFYEFQIDLFFINDLPKQRVRAGMICIDILTKYLNVVPIASKQPADMLAGIMENLKKMGKKPKMIYVDDEGSFNNQSVIDYLDEENFEIHRTRGHPAFAERSIRTIKEMLYKRVEADEKKGKQNIQWVDYLSEKLFTYNQIMVHSSHNMTPTEEKKPRNEYKVRMELGFKAKRNRIYPEIDKGDEVGIFRKKRPNEKERVGNYTKTIYTIERIEKKLGQNYYYIENYKKPFLRNELLKV